MTEHMHFTALPEDRAEALAAAFLTGPAPEYIDIEAVAARGLGLSVISARFAAADREIRGFLSDGATPVFTEERDGICRRTYPTGTVVINSSLCGRGQAGLRRFVIAHECAHVLLEGAPAFCRADAADAASLQEARVNRLAAALLMPRFLVEQSLRELLGTALVTCYGESFLAMEERTVVCELAARLQVPYTALMRRLEELSLLDRRSAAEYLRDLPRAV